MNDFYIPIDWKREFVGVYLKWIWELNNTLETNEDNRCDKMEEILWSMMIDIEMDTMVVRENCEGQQ